MSILSENTPITAEWLKNQGWREDSWGSIRDRQKKDHKTWYHRFLVYEEGYPKAFKDEKEFEIMYFPEIFAGYVNNIKPKLYFKAANHFLLTMDHIADACISTDAVFSGTDVETFNSQLALLLETARRAYIASNPWIKDKNKVVVEACQPKDLPEPGTVGTLYVGSDRYPMLVTAKITEKRIRVAHMSHEDYQYIEAGSYTGIDLIQSGTYDPDKCTIYTKRKNGYWYPMGASSKHTGALILGEADYYQDPSF